MIEYSIIRSTRKTLAIHITKNAKVEVRAPFELSKAIITAFINEKEQWIETHLRAIKKNSEASKTFFLKDGDRLLVLGQEIPLVFCKGQKAIFDGECFYVEPSEDPLKIKVQVIGLYRRLARKILTDKVTDFGKMMGVYPSGLKINGANTRWGSCSGKNSLNFSWKLMMGSEDAVDYVVVHELAHILEHNHSAHFWEIVRKQMPDFEQRKEKLKILAQQLSAENWDIKG
ncbi:MAG: SprT family zinc-dependent metalloprotease [Eubacterium sp.]